MARDVERAPVGGRPDAAGRVVSGEFGDLNRHRARELVLDNFRELGFFATKAEVAAEAERMRMPPQLQALLERLPAREYVSVEDVTGEAVRPHPGGD